MTATAEPSASTTQIPRVEADASTTLGRAEGIELLGCVHGCGYRDGASLVRRADGQIVQLGQLLYGLLECIDGQRDVNQLAEALSQELGRRVEDRHVLRLAQKLAQQGLLAGTEQNAPAKRNPLLALRWKVLVTNPKWTRRLTAPLAFLFRPWILWPAVAAFAAVFWFVLIHKGVASATSQAFHQPALLLLVFVLAVVSAGFHELGHAAACKYSGATPGGMGMGLYLVWPAFYTDVTETYQLPKRDRLRVDLAGLYFNVLTADLTLAVWLVVRADALLLLVALQVLQMVKQLSPVIRADGYHILSDATGVPDLFSHIGPTLKRLLPGHRNEPSALTGRARAIVSVWVLIVVPVLLSLMIGAILVLPHVATSAWESGRSIANSMPGQVSRAQIIDLLASLVQLLALVLPVIGSLLVTQKVVRMGAHHGRNWSRGSVPRGIAATLVALLMMSGVAWAWWPSGQYRPVRPNQGGTIASLARTVVSPIAAARPAEPEALLTAGTHLAVSMVPVGGATAQHPALHVILGGNGKEPVAIVGGGLGRAGAATAFRFHFSGSSGSNSTAAVIGTKKGAIKYNVAYSLVTVSHGAPVTSRNTAVAIGHCKGCMSVAVSFQVVLIVGQSNVIAPVNNAFALNTRCPACTTVALADQMVITLSKQPSRHLLAELKVALKRLHALSKLRGRFAARRILKEVAAVQRKIEAELVASGLMTNPPSSSTSSSSSGSSGGSSTTSSGSGGGGSGASTSSGASTTTTTTAPSNSGYGTTGTTSTPTTSSTTTATSTTSTSTTGSSTTPTTTTSGGTG